MKQIKTAQARYWVLLCMGMLLFSIPGCVKDYEYLKTEFPQGDVQALPKDLVQNSLRTTAVYDQFTTLAHFDVLWLSDAVRTVEVSMLANYKGKNKNIEARSGMLRAALERNKDKISFYVLADVQSEFHAGLDDATPMWHMVLIAPSGMRLSPILIKEVELGPEYNAFFTENILHYRTAYLVEFSATQLSIEDRERLAAQFTLEFNSYKTSIHLTFGSLTSAEDQEAPQTERVGVFIPDEDYYWGRP